MNKLPPIKITEMQNIVKTSIKDSLKKYTGMPNTPAVMRQIQHEVESWKLTTPMFYTVNSKFIKLNIEKTKTHNFEILNLTENIYFLRCMKCSMTAESDRGVFFAEENLSCNEYIMKEVIE